jgi:NitT/TauT family transport system permease protein
MDIVPVGPAGDRPGSGARLREFLFRFASPLVVLSLLAIWQLIAMAFAIPVYILPQPVNLITALPATGRTLFNGWAVTMMEASAGFIIGNVFSIAVAFLVTVSSTARAGIMPVALAIKSVPMVAITPLITLSVGFGHATVVTVAALVCFFPTLVNVSRGLKAAPRGAMDLFHIIDANPVQTFWKLRLPYALPYLFTALRITAPAAFGGAMLAEYVASNAGLGYLIQDGYSRFQFILVWQIVVLATVTTLTAFSIVVWFEKRVVDSKR